MLTRRAIISACAVAVLACACSSSGGGEAAPPTTEAKTSTTKSTPTTKSSPVSSTAPTGSATTVAPVSTVPQTRMSDLILPDAGPGFALQPDSIADTGPTDIAKAADDDINPKARKVLQATKFVQGYQRQWKSTDSEGNINNAFIFLYEFETPGGAQLYAQQWRQTLEDTHAGIPLTPFVPPDIPEALGLTSATKAGSTGVVIFWKGNYAVQTLVNNVNLSCKTCVAADQSGAATGVALLQYDRLP